MLYWEEQQKVEEFLIRKHDWSVGPGSAGPKVRLDTVLGDKAIMMELDLKFYFWEGKYQCLLRN